MIATSVLREAWRAMGQNRLRAALTMLGMVIGVASVVLMLAVGEGARVTVNEQISSMGSNLIIVLPGATTSGGMRMGSGTALPLTVMDAEAIGRLPEVEAAAPMQSGTSQLVHGNQNWSSLVYGITPEFWRVRGWELARGDPFTEADLRSAAAVAIIGQVVAENLFPGEDPIGKTVRIRNIPFRVVGVLAAKGQSLDGRDQDDTVHVPISTAQRRLFGMQIPGAVRYILVSGRPSPTLAESEDAIRALLRQRRRVPQGGEDDFSVRNLTEAAQAAAAAARVLSVMLGAIASVSLVVGGIGIMNIMLVSVTERTREIGIRMAVGARRRDVLGQFLAEAVMICGYGGLAGVAIGIGGAWAVSQLADMSVVVSARAVGLALAFSVAVGLFFGLYPARRAAALNPVEALRHE